MGWGRALNLPSSPQISLSPPQIPPPQPTPPLTLTPTPFFPPTEEYGSYEAAEGPGGDGLYPEGPLEEEGAPGIAEFLPSAQRALFLRIRHKQQRPPDERGRRAAEGARGDREHEEGETGLGVGWVLA